MPPMSPGQLEGLFPGGFPGWPAVAGEFAEKAVSPLGNPLIGRMAELGVETDADRDQVAALAVAWWDGTPNPLDPGSSRNEAPRPGGRHSRMFIRETRPS